MTRIFCCGLALLFACSGDLTESGASPEARVVGFWAFSSAAVEPDPDVPGLTAPEKCEFWIGVQ
jgi:hypothetical protein